MRTVRDGRLLRRARGTSQSDGGFTLVEAVVALLVLALIFTALAMVSVSAIRASLFSRQNQQAGDLIGQRLEQLRPLSLDSLANVATDMTGDSRVQSCSGQPCINTGAGTEDLILDPNGSVTPHITTVQSATTNQTRFTVATYVTVPAGQDPSYQRRVTVFVTWTSTSGLHTRTDSSIMSYGRNGLPLPYFKFVPMGPTSSSVNPGARIYFGYTLINQGAPDHWNIAAADSAGNSWTFVFDDGNQAYNATTDTTAVTDTTGDGIIDTGLVQPGTSVSFWAYRDVPAGAPASTSTLTVTVTSVGQPTASSATASITDTANVVNGVISPTSTPTSSSATPTSSPTSSSPSPTSTSSSCPMPSPVPTASAASGYSLVQYTLHNAISGGATTDQSQLSMDTNPVYNSILYPYSTDLSGSSGRLVQPGGSAASTVVAQYADWRYQFAASGSVNGAATLTFWVSTPDPSLNVTAYLYEMIQKGSSGKYTTTTVTTVPISMPAFTCAGFQQITVAISVASLSFGANDYIGVRIVNGGSSPVTLAYDATAYPANVVLPRK